MTPLCSNPPVFITVKLYKESSADHVAKAHNVQLVPMHPGNKELSSYFYVTVDGLTEAEKVTKALQASKEVEAAYTKPKDAAPKWTGARF